MNIELVAREVELTGEFQDRMEKKLERILERRNMEQPVRVQVTENRGRFQTLITMHLHGKEVIGQAEEKNIFAALDDAVDKVDRQVRRIYDRLSQKR